MVARLKRVGEYVIMVMPLLHLARTALAMLLMAAVIFGLVVFGLTRLSFKESFALMATAAFWVVLVGPLLVRSGSTDGRA